MRRHRVRCVPQASLCLEEFRVGARIQVQHESGARVETRVDSSGCAVFSWEDVGIVPAALPVMGVELDLRDAETGEAETVTILPPDVDGPPVLG